MEARAVRGILAKNPFPHPYTLGMFYREKMRAIASVVPQVEFRDVLEVGGGTSGLTSLFFPDARVVNVDADPQVAERWSWLKNRAELVPGVATDLPFEQETFDCVTAFDVLEHVPDDETAAKEILRVLRPGGYVLISSPSEQWRYPYYGRGFRRICYNEEEVITQWGHVRRGYSLDELQRLFPGCEPVAMESYINGLTVIAHDIAFSKLAKVLRMGLVALQYPLTLAGYVFGCPGPRMGFAVAMRRVW